LVRQQESLVLRVQEARLPSHAEHNVNEHVIRNNDHNDLIILVGTCNDGDDGDGASRLDNDARGVDDQSDSEKVDDETAHGTA